VNTPAASEIQNLCGAENEEKTPRNTLAII
jgi:hypothetical protein